MLRTCFIVNHVNIISIIENAFFAGCWRPGHASVDTPSPQAAARLVYSPTYCNTPGNNKDVTCQFAIALTNTATASDEASHRTRLLCARDSYSRSKTDYDEQTASWRSTATLWIPTKKSRSKVSKLRSTAERYILLILYSSSVGHTEVINFQDILYCLL